MLELLELIYKTILFFEIGWIVGLTVVGVPAMVLGARTNAKRATALTSPQDN